MPRLTVSLQLPYVLRIGNGDYETDTAGGFVRVTQPPLLEGTRALTTLSTVFDHEDSIDRDLIFRLQTRDAEELLRRANRLLRWHRASSRTSDAVELTRDQASPFRFEATGAATESELWNQPVEYEAMGPRSLRLGLDELSDMVRAGLAAGGEPDVADLFLIDAERALREGRFRECVLFCWSTIDSTFNRRYNQLVNASLAGEWRQARDFFTGVDFGLRNKMSAVMHLVAGRSLFREPPPFWEDLSASYRKRNGIIHEGEGASEDEAKLALEIAHRVVGLVRSL
jgi:hypothetical protein